MDMTSSVRVGGLYADKTASSTLPIMQQEGSVRGLPSMQLSTWRPEQHCLLPRQSVLPTNYGWRE